MMGRYVLPWFGGGPAVWTDCLLFFQTLLLAGYAYAHWLGSRREAWVHIALLAASLWLVVSGYALYYSGSEALRAFASATHFWIGVAFAVVFGVHLRSAG